MLLSGKAVAQSDEKTFEQGIVNRFGQRLYRIFFETYTEKVWGNPYSTIQADWAPRRIKELSLKTVVLDTHREVGR